MLETKPLVIEEFTYDVTQFTATVGLDILSELMQLVGEGLGRTETGAGDAAEALVRQLGKTKASDLIKRLVGMNVKINGQPMQGHDAFDLHFAGEYKRLLTVVAFVLEVNFVDFFSDLKGWITEMFAKTQEEITTGETSSPTSKPDDK